MRKVEAFTPVTQCRVEQVIITLVVVGDGTEKNPYRNRTEVRKLDGELVATFDPEYNCQTTKTILPELLGGRDEQGEA